MRQLLRRPIQVYMVARSDLSQCRSELSIHRPRSVMYLHLTAPFLMLPCNTRDFSSHMISHRDVSLARVESEVYT